MFPTFIKPGIIPHVLEIHVVAGTHAEQNPQVLIEVPHGADRTADFDGLLAQLGGPFPSGLVDFFHLNTDVGAWALGVAVAERWVDLCPTLHIELIRSLIPRTFIDCNRPADFGGANVAGGLTPGIPSYVKNDDDRAHLLALHRRYVEETTARYADICGRGGQAFIPHTYGPRTLGIERVDDDIVKNLHWACAPERHDTWPLRAEVDILTRDDEGTLLCDPRLETDLMHAFASAGFAPKLNDTYSIHPASLAHTHAVNFPRQVTCLEVRRDLLVDTWTPFAEMHPVEEKVGRAADVIANYFAAAHVGLT